MELNDTAVQHDNLTVDVYRKKTEHSSAEIITNATQSSSFRFGFFGLRERLFALHNGHIGALRCICWWQERQAYNHIGTILCTLLSRSTLQSHSWLVNSQTAPTKCVLYENSQYIYAHSAVLQLLCR